MALLSPLYLILRKQPENEQMLQDEAIHSIGVGTYNNIAITDKGSLLTWGPRDLKESNLHQPLEHVPRSKLYTGFQQKAFSISLFPSQVLPFVPRSISCGENFSLLIDGLSLLSLRASLFHHQLTNRGKNRSRKSLELGILRRGATGSPFSFVVDRRKSPEGGHTSGCRMGSCAGSACRRHAMGLGIESPRSSWSRPCGRKANRTKPWTHPSARGGLALCGGCSRRLPLSCSPSKSAMLPRRTSRCELGKWS